MDKENTGLKTMVESYENILKRKINFLPEIDPRSLSKGIPNGTRPRVVTTTPNNNAPVNKQATSSSNLETPSTGQQRNSSVVIRQKIMKYV